MSEKKEKIDLMEQPVPVCLFRDGERYSGDVFVAVNGESVLIRRGETVNVRRKFADVLEKSRRQDLCASGLMDKAQGDRPLNPGE